MHKSQSRERLRGACDPFVPVEPQSYEPMNAVGCVQPRNYIKPLRMELGSNTSCGAPKSNSFPFDFKSSSKKETRTPIRATLAEEMSTERQIKRSSPSVIAKLMGLDALPSPGSYKPSKEVSSFSGKPSSKVLKKHTRDEDCLLKKCSDEYQECKDVFEVIEGQSVGNHKKQGIQKQMPNLKHSEMDMTFIRQSFINAKRLSTDEKLQKSKEFDDALEVLESNKDLFLKLLQEPHSFFSEHVQDQSQSSLFQHASHPSIRKSSRGSLIADHESPLLPEIKVGRYTSSQLNDSLSLRQHTKSIVHPFKQHICSLPEEYSDSIYGGKVEGGPPHKQIVILKPSLNNAQFLERTARSVMSLENSKHGVTNHRDLSKEEIINFFQKESDRQNLKTLGNTRHRTKHITELAKNVTQEIRSSSVTGRKASGSKYGNNVRDNDLWHITSNAGAKSSPTSYKNYDNIDGYYKNLCPSPSCAIESSVNMEARKHLSEQRKLTRCIHEIGLSMRESNTLSEMLALSNKEISKSARHTSFVKKACPSSISSKDGWKNGFSRNLSRSKSVPVQSPVYQNSQYNSTKGVICSKNRVMPKNICIMDRDEFVDGDQIEKNSSLKYLGDRQNKSKLHSVEENKLPVLQMHVSSEEFKHRSNLEIHIEEDNTACNFSDIHSPDIVDIFSVPSHNIAESSFSINCKGLEELQKVTRSGINGKRVECGHRDMFSKPESSSNHGGDVLPHPNFCKSSVPPICSEEADQPNPVSVLDASSKDDNSAPGCFEKISADLQELRRQLQTLKIDSDNIFAKEIEAFISSEEDAAEPFSQLGDVHQSFRDEEDRDYSYLLDMLIDSEILKSDKSGLFGACGSTELPVGLDVFHKLEKKYKSIEPWSRSGRKLLFDLVNSTISDIADVPLLVKSRFSWQSKMACEGLVEEIWQAVVKRRKEVSSYSEEDFIGLQWSGFGHVVSEVVGRELESMLSENLIDELVEELMYM